MKYDKFFALAKEKGIEEAEISVSTSYNFSVSLFHSEIDQYSTSNSSTFMARGIYKGKMGAVVSDVYDKDSAELFVKTIIENASVIENDDPVFRRLKNVIQELSKLIQSDMKSHLLQI